MKKSYDSKFKSRVALEALRGELTVAEIAGKYHSWKELPRFSSPRPSGKKGSRIQRTI